MNLDFRLRDPVDDNNSEEINLPQMQESRYRGNPERLLLMLGLTLWLSGMCCLSSRKMRVVPPLEEMMDR